VSVVGRRAFVLGTALAACTRKESVTIDAGGATPPPSTVAFTPGPRGKTEIVQWTLEGMCTEVAIVVPSWADPSGRFPILVALHGRGEAVKPPRVGALGWANDYGMLHAIERLCAPPLTDADYQGLSDPVRLATANKDLETRPFRGLVVVCPHVPDLDLNGTKDAERYGAFLTQVLLPRVRRETPVATGPESTGIDGVSLGGALALRIGLVHGETFGAIGALQPAIGDERLSELTDLALAARAKRPKVPLRLTTSHDDYYKPWVTKLSDRWRSAGISHDFADVPGPHDYVFNRGPGVYEMLLWHDRALV
jgi:iron(III)-salmochelin esterase